MGTCKTLVDMFSLHHFENSKTQGDEYMFKVNNKDTRTMSHAVELLLTLNRFLPIDITIGNKNPSYRNFI